MPVIDGKFKEDRGSLNIDHLTIREWMATHLLAGRVGSSQNTKWGHPAEYSGDPLLAVELTDALLKALHPDGPS